MFRSSSSRFGDGGSIYITGVSGHSDSTGACNPAVFPVGVFPLSSHGIRTCLASGASSSRIRIAVHHARSPVLLRDHASRPSGTPSSSRNDWHTIRKLLPYLLEYRGRVAAALAFLAAAKIANVGVPLVMKEIIDSLDTRQAVLALPFALLLIYGLLRLSNTLFAELRDIVFVRVAKRAIRRVALPVFRRLPSLSLRFHLERQTGGVSRDIERGTRGISTLLSYMLFSIIPVFIEFSHVAFVLLAKFDW